jgi:hypothetical protein
LSVYERLSYVLLVIAKVLSKPHTPFGTLGAVISPQEFGVYFLGIEHFMTVFAGFMFGHRQAPLFTINRITISPSTSYASLLDG